MGQSERSPISDQEHRENVEALGWRREWEQNNRPEHSCVQESVALLSGRSVCGVCGALIDL